MSPGDVFQCCSKSEIKEKSLYIDQKKKIDIFIKHIIDFSVYFFWQMNNYDKCGNDY